MKEYKCNKELIEYLESKNVKGVKIVKLKFISNLLIFYGIIFMRINKGYY